MNSKDFLRHINRRSFLTLSAYGLGGLALGRLMHGTARAASGMVGTHYAPRVKRIIHLCMAGGPSQHESFDWKPKLKALDGQLFPESFTKGQQLAQLQGSVLKARGSFVNFRKHGLEGKEKIIHLHC